MDDDRIVDIEEKLAHQEDTLAALNEALTKQQEQVSRLEAMCRTLADRIRALSEARTKNDDGDRPPHY